LFSSTAQKKAGYLLLPIAKRVHCPSELYFHRQSQTKPPCPVRICDKSEIIFASCLPQEWNEEKKALVQYLGEYDTGANKRALVDLNKLTPYNGETGDTSAWDPELVKQYIVSLSKRTGKNKLDAVQLRVEEICLDKILKRAYENKEAARLQKLQDEQEILALRAEEDTKENIPVPRATKTSRSPPRPVNLDGAPDKGEPLRAGDMIEYTNPQFVTGHRQGRRVATILCVRKDKNYKLVLDTGELLPNTDLVRRIYRIVRNKRVPYNGDLKAIDDHKCTYCEQEVTNAVGVQRNGQKLAEIVDSNAEKLRQVLEESGMPLDLVRNFGKSKKPAGGEDSVMNQPMDKQKMPAALEKDKRHDSTLAKDQLIPAVDKDRMIPRNCNVLRDASLVNGLADGNNKKEASETDELPSETAVSQRVQAEDDDMKYLQSELLKFILANDSGSGRRRRGHKCHTTMTESQLQYAVKVREIFPERSITEISELLYEQKLGVNKYWIETFLAGDPNRVLQASKHLATEEALAEWISRHNNK